MLPVVVVVVEVSVMQVLIDGIIGSGITATAGWGLTMGPQAVLCLENSGNHSLMALRRACRGWYMLGERLEGTSSPSPSSVSVSNLISAETVSSGRTRSKQNTNKWGGVTQGQVPLSVDVTPGPLRQRVDRDEVSTVLAIRIGQDAPQLGNQIRGSPRIRPEKDALLVVVVGVEVVPDDGRPPQSIRDFLYVFFGQHPRDHLLTWKNRQNDSITAKCHYRST
jgi:hypothetical protein